MRAEQARMRRAQSNPLNKHKKCACVETKSAHHLCSATVVVGWATSAYSRVAARATVEHKNSKIASIATPLVYSCRLCPALTQRMPSCARGMAVFRGASHATQSTHRSAMNAWQAPATWPTNNTTQHNHSTRYTRVKVTRTPAMQSDAPAFQACRCAGTGALHP